MAGCTHTHTPPESSSPRQHGRGNTERDEKGEVEKKHQRKMYSVSPALSSTRNKNDAHGYLDHFCAFAWGRYILRHFSRTIPAAPADPRYCHDALLLFEGVDGKRETLPPLTHYACINGKNTRLTKKKKGVLRPVSQKKFCNNKRLTTSHLRSKISSAPTPPPSIPPARSACNLC